MKTKPQGSLTGSQLEILEVVWTGAPEALTAAEIWQRLQEARPTARTTVLTLLHRLEKRGWLLREGEGRGAVYRAACSREEATARLAADFVNTFFGGSTSRLVLSLLGNREAGPEEIGRLKQALRALEGEEKP